MVSIQNEITTKASSLSKTMPLTKQETVVRDWVKTSQSRKHSLISE